MKTKEELTKIFEESKEKLYSLAYRLVGNKEDALDIVQETFLRSLSSLKRFREGSSLYTWLYRITYNLSLAKAHYFFGLKNLRKNLKGKDGLPEV